METWIIYLIASAGVIGLGIMYLLGAKKLVMQKKTIVALVVACAIIAAPTVGLWWANDSSNTAKANETKALQAAFNAHYNAGDTANFTAIKAIKTDAYLVLRATLDADGEIDLSAGTKQSLYISGTWLEVTGMDE